MARKNFAVGSILTAPSPATSGTSVVLNSGHGARMYVGKAFYVPANFNPLTDTAEEITISVISTDTLTIVRNTDSRGAATMVVGGIIRQGITATEIDALAAGVNGLNSATTVVNTSAATAPSSGQVLTATSSTAATWQAAGLDLTKLRHYLIEPSTSDSAILYTISGSATASQDNGLHLIMTSNSSDRIQFTTRLAAVPYLAMFDSTLVGRLSLRQAASNSNIWTLIFGTSAADTASFVSKSIGFRSASSIFYAKNASGTTETSTNITASVPLNTLSYKDLEVVHTPAVNDKFYVNKTLVATHTTNLPSGDASAQTSWWSTNYTSNSATGEVIMGAIEMWQQLP